MKTAKTLLILGLVAATVAFSGCSTKSKTADAEKSEKPAPSVVSTVEQTTQQELNLLVFDGNGIKLTYTGYEGGAIPKFNFLIENNSDKTYNVMSEDESINDCMITMGLIEKVAPGKKSAVSMSFFKSELEKNKIENIEKLEFKMHFSNADDFMETFDSDVITINNP